MQPIRIAIIGQSVATADYHLAALGRLNYVNLRVLGGIGDLDPEPLARQHTVPFWTRSIDKVLVDPEIDAVLLATAPKETLPMAVEAVRQRKHVHLTLPIDQNDAAFEELRQAVIAEQKLVMCWPYVLSPAITAARQMLQQNEIGPLARLSVPMTFSPPGYQGTDWVVAIEPLFASLPEAWRRWIPALPALMALTAIGGMADSLRMSGDESLPFPRRMEVHFQRGGVGVLTGERELIVDAERGRLTTIDPDRVLMLEPKGNSSRILGEGGPTEQDTTDKPLRVNLSRFPKMTSHQRWVNSMLTGGQPSLTGLERAEHATRLLRMANQTVTARDWQPLSQGI